MPGRSYETPDFFGLLSRSWPHFVGEIEGLKSACSESISYKVLFLGRHGEGNRRKWALLDGDGELTWGPDPRLTAIGEEQARSAHAAWEREILRGVPIPQESYCSPLTRAIRTFELTFVDVLPAHMKPLIVEVLEIKLSHVLRNLLTHPNQLLVQNCREEIGEHTCDKRRTRSEIHSDFPGFAFEEGFEEEDVLWSPERETKESAERRAKLFLDRVFENGHDNTYISVTTHSGWINAVLRVIGQGNYPLPTGGLIVVVVKSVLLE
ncbi:phosphoglycerate mutase-like protein [Lactarius pseudohatsudake]|nr:phosphoglycerate mutase-like protein [Lactarius pseudohatsudake]